ncbi:hypothetical protein OY671_012257, partial [Metschnikowia pulcherrima]
GPSSEAESDASGRASHEPKRPSVAIVGGSKVSTKSSISQSSADKVDQSVVGGGIANTFMSAAGSPISSTAVAASAQSAGGQPMPSGPPGQSAPPTMSQDEPPPAFLKVVPSPSLETPPRPPAAGGRFEMEESRAPDIEAVGVLDDKQGGLGAG